MMKSSFYALLILLALLIITGGCSNSSPATPSLQGEGYPIPSTGNNNGFTGTLDQSELPVLINPDELKKWADDELLVVLRDGEDPDLLYRTARGIGLSLIREIRTSFGTVYRLHIDSGQSVMSVVEDLKKRPEVKIAEPNFLVYPASVPYYPNDPLFEYPGDPDDDPWNHMYDQWGPNMLGASLVWPTEKGSPDVTVAVLDSGYRYTHEDLINQIWINEDEIADNGIDDDDNGYIDDWRGWDFDSHDNDPWDTNGHGTACSGVVAAEQDNTVGCTGIAPGVKVMPCRINMYFDGLVSSVVEAAQYAYDNGADIISMSFRNYEYSEIFHNIFIAVWDDGNGLLPIGAAGNENNDNLTYPANFPEVFMVGATCSFYETGERRDVKRLTAADYGWGSSYGENLEIMAPGELSITTRVTSDSSYYDGPGGVFNGTSNATPCVAGCAALLLSANPGWTPAQVRDRLNETADDIHEPGRDNESGFGRVNILRAIHGSEPNSSNYDVNGHMPLAMDDVWLYDNLYDITTSADYDFEDIFVVDVTVSGVLYADVDIITTGQDLDIEIYDDPALTTPIATSVGPNNYLDPLEILTLLVEEGETYYIRVFSPAPFNCSTYRIRSRVEFYYWRMDWESIAPEIVANSSDAVPLLKLQIESNEGVTVDEIKTYVTSGAPLSFMNRFTLYDDTNNSGEWEDAFDLAVADVEPAITGLNQLPFTDVNKFCSNENPLTLFVVADVGPVEAGTPIYFGAGIRSYKDITILEGAKFIDDPFPFQSDPVLLIFDDQPPYWDSTIGIQETKGEYYSVRLYWNLAWDLYSEPVTYNVYYDENDPPSIATASLLEDVPLQSGGSYIYSTVVNGLIVDQKYFFCVRAEDAIGHEDDNLVWLEGIPNSDSDPENPIVLSSLPLIGYAEEIWVHNQIAYVATTEGGLAIVDCSNSSLPELIDTYECNSCLAVQYHDTQDLVYIASANGLEIIDPDTPSGPVQVGVYAGGGTSALFVDGDRCYIAIGATLHVIDVSTPSAPTSMGSINLPGGFVTIQEIWVKGDYAYLAAYPGMHVIDVSDPTQMSDEVSLNLNWFTYEITGQGNLVFVTNYYYHMLYVIDITDPLSSYVLGSIDLGQGYATEVAIRDESYLYTGTVYTYIFSVNWTDIGNMTIPGNVATLGAEGLYYDGELLYSAEGANGMKIIL